MGNLHKVGFKKDITEGKAISILLEGKSIGIFNVAGKFYAVDNECTHAGAPLCEGEISGTTLTCPWHGAKFDLTNGSAIEAPAFDPVKCYKVVLEGDNIKIEI